MKGLLSGTGGGPTVLYPSPKTSRRQHEARFTIMSTSFLRKPMPATGSRQMLSKACQQFYTNPTVFHSRRNPPGHTFVATHRGNSAYLATTFLGQPTCHLCCQSSWQAGHSTTP